MEKNQDELMNEDWIKSYGGEPDLFEITNTSKETIEIIDNLLMNNVNRNWRKTVLVIVKTLKDLKYQMPDCKVTDLFCAMRIRKLVEENNLEAQGDLFRMRFSEVRLSNSFSNDQFTKD